MNKGKKIIVFVLCVVVLLPTLLTQNVYGTASTFRALTITERGEWVESQLPFVLGRRIYTIGDERFSGARDIYADTANNLLYIADTNNGRILVSDYYGNLVRIIGEGILQSPQGVTVGNRSGDIFVADHRAERVFRFTPYGDLVFEFTIPTEPLFGANARFQPIKVATDIADNVYIVSAGNPNGIIQMTENGEFLGYFGANLTHTSIMDIIRRRIYTEAQMARRLRNVPNTPTNLVSNADGLIFTITAGETADTGLRKLNMGGSPIFYSEMHMAAAAVAVSDHTGSVYVATRDGLVYMYTSEGYVLFAFGGSEMGTSRIGLFNDVSGITVNQYEHIFLIDGSENVIQVFYPSEFMEALMPALGLFHNGHFAQSRGPWAEVLRMNRTFQFAYNGLGQAEFALGNFHAAMDAFYLGDNQEGFSDAFWEVRNAWLNRYVIHAVFAIVGFFLLIRIIKRTHKRFGYLDKPLTYLRRFADIKLVREIRYMGYFVKHPVDGFYGIRFEGKTSVLSATLIYLLAFSVYIISRYFSGFIFLTVARNEFNLLFDIALVGGVTLFLVVCNYLVSTIRDGEGSFKVVYMSVAYALMPFILFEPIRFALTHVLTMNEAVILAICRAVAFIWVSALLVIMIGEVHRYEASGVVKNILITVSAAVVMGLVGFVIFLMSNQLFDFAYSIVQEVLYRAWL